MKPSKEERSTMTRDEMLRALWLLDEHIEAIGWHFVSRDGFPESNKHGYWCKLADGRYRVLYFKDGFYEQRGSMDIYIPENNPVIAWQRLTEINML